MLKYAGDKKRPKIFTMILDMMVRKDQRISFFDSHIFVCRSIVRFHFLLAHIGCQHRNISQPYETHLKKHIECIIVECKNVSTMRSIGDNKIQSSWKLNDIVMKFYQLHTFLPQLLPGIILKNHHFSKLFNFQSNIYRGCVVTLPPPYFYLSKKFFWSRKFSYTREPVQEMSVTVRGG